ncbi:MAG: hypothetical protein LC793_05940 [Thermomicrobia bacterium]|nr:hypothetical protein [Thermomicrobia bacterium]
METYDNGWWRAVDEKGALVYRVTNRNILHSMTGVTAKRVRERMRDEMPEWVERKHDVTTTDL